MFDLCIDGATVVDGSGAPAYVADVGVCGGTIAAIGQLSQSPAQQRIDANGQVLSPGFIDVHTHDDRALLIAGMMEAKLSQGVTTVVTGNCGLSLAPGRLRGAIPPPLDLIATPEWLRFARFGDYLQALEESAIAVNAMCLVGHLTLRANVMDSLDRAATDAECAAMRELLAEALAAGAWGMSTGTFYAPARHASADEIVAVGEPLRGAGGLFTTHMRNEGELVAQSLEETFSIGRRLGVRVLISHHKLAGIANHGRSRETLDLIAAAMQRQPVSLDAYPYNASSTVLRPEFIARASAVRVSWSEKHPDQAGRLLAEIAADWQCDQESAANRLMPAGAIYFMMDEEDVRRILAFPKTMIGSDGMPHDDYPHPRLWGTFPRVLGHYCREQQLFDLTTAIHKMSGLPASELGLSRRGTIAENHAADLLLFDPQTVADTASYDEPRSAATGISHVWVNGRLAYTPGVLHDHGAGRVLRRTARTSE
ncbi:MAG: D-aminoacylase [Proteobacteria bacterium]|nr:D-aminoacylase [Pseudomonadota bacterium]